MTTHLATATLRDVQGPANAVFARVDVTCDVASVNTLWGELEASTPSSIYQTRAWLEPWIATLGRRAAIAPYFAVARDADGRALALLPFGIVRRGPLRIATWLGGRDSNFNMALMKPGVAWTRAELLRFLRAAADGCGAARPDLFSLGNQPATWDGRPNPFALLQHQASPSAAFGTDLPRDADALFAEKLSKESRKKLRKKETRLATFGPLLHVVATSLAAQRQIVDTFIAQKVARFEDRQVVSEFATPEMRDFIVAASRPAGAGIELHALYAGERIVAVYGGAAHRGQWSGMFNAFDSDEEIAKASPGDLLLLRVIAAACAAGATRFDLGIGEARYKAALCDETIPLFDTKIAVTLRGAVAGRLLALRQAAKTRIKRNPRLLAFARKLEWLTA